MPNRGIQEAGAAEVREIDLLNVLLDDGINEGDLRDRIREIEADREAEEILERAELEVAEPGVIQPIDPVIHWGFIEHMQVAPPIINEGEQIRRHQVPQGMLDALGRARNRRGLGLEVRRDDDVDLPVDIIEEPRVIPRPILRPERRTSTKSVKKKLYPEEGVMFHGQRYSRALNYIEECYVNNYGYTECLRKYPDLIYKEKEKPIDDKEECIILMSELADYYAIEECKNTLKTFNLKDHNKEYQTAYKKHLKAITGFKRNKNG